MTFHQRKAYNNRNLSYVTLKFRSSSVFLFDSLRLQRAYFEQTIDRLHLCRVLRKTPNKSQQTCCHMIIPGQITSWQILNIEGKHSYVFNYLLYILSKKTKFVIAYNLYHTCDLEHRLCILGVLSSKESLYKRIISDVDL